MAKKPKKEKTVSKIECNTCGKLVKRYFVGNFDFRNKKYQDKHGRLFNGRCCPDCQAEKMKLHMRVRRAISGAN